MHRSITNDILRTSLSRPHSSASLATSGRISRESFELAWSLMNDYDNEEALVEPARIQHQSQPKTWRETSISGFSYEKPIR